ncbi:hypothetical protein EJ08DRAFT_738765 [Tothia fuscella]|uniref:Uncharacterized protein n=1 Tax=Tothia fuscella TaxID=1048955 RepID=A0A9P4TSC9_9PEZI|nr:hypothetical protein EJ08DRAFT_738765 [Tothia fuscella]
MADMTAAMEQLPTYGVVAFRTATFPFLKLPAELRIKVYEHAFAPAGDKTIEIGYKPRLNAPAQLLATCSQIHQEGKEILYTEMVFFLTSPWGIEERFLRNIGVDNANLIRFAQLNIHHPDDCLAVRDFSNLQDICFIVDHPQNHHSSTTAFRDSPEYIKAIILSILQCYNSTQCLSSSIYRVIPNSETLSAFRSSGVGHLFHRLDDQGCTIRFKTGIHFSDNGNHAVGPGLKVWFKLLVDDEKEFGFKAVYLKEEKVTAKVNFRPIRN